MFAQVDKTVCAFGFLTLPQQLSSDEEDLLLDLGGLRESPIRPCDMSSTHTMKKVRFNSGDVDSGGVLDPGLVSARTWHRAGDRQQIGE